MSPLEARIGYKFRNSLFLAEALTHPSLGFETKQPHFDNQRLEFLGDAVLQLIFTEHLYQAFPQFNEGQLTKLRARLVSRTGLQDRAAQIELGKYVMMGRGEEASGGRERASVLANAFEALIGALYLDGGFEVARQFALKESRALLRDITKAPDEINPKGELQEILQAIAAQSPRYEILSESGPDHERKFESSVVWEGIELARGHGRSKKAAETAAAIAALAARAWDQRAGHPVGSGAEKEASSLNAIPTAPPVTPERL